MVTRIVEAFGEEIWTVEGDRVNMFGIPFGTRMTVVRLGDGRLWLHSPVQPSEERFLAVAELGAVAHIVAPNKFHHLFVGPWCERFASAQAWAGPGLARRRPDLSFAGELGDEPPDAWCDELDQVCFRGSKILPEPVFFHRRSRTAIFTDLIQNHEPSEDGTFWRTLKRLNGIVAPDGGVPRDLRLTMLDRGAARRARDRVLAWDVDKLILSHGRYLRDGAHAFVERAFAWLG